MIGVTPVYITASVCTFDPDTRFPRILIAGVTSFILPYGFFMPKLLRMTPGAILFPSACPSCA